MPVNTSITFRKGSSSQWSATNPVLASGEPGYDLTNNILKIGDGVSAWNSLSNHSHSSSDITNFNSSVSGLLPAISNSGNNRILTSTGSAVGINAEDKLTFDGTTFVCSGEAIIGDSTVSHYLEHKNGVFLIKDAGSNNFILVDTEEARLAYGGGDSVRWGDRQLVKSNNSPILDWSNGIVVGTGNSINLQNVLVIDDSNFLYLYGGFNSGLISSEDSSIDRFAFINGSIENSAIGSQLPSSGNFTNLKVNNINVSVSGHTHLSSDITNFNSSVSGLLPVTNILSGTNIIVSSNSGIYTIGTSGVQSLFTTINNTIVGNTSISAARALRYNALTFSPVTADITLPSSGHLIGDVIVITSAGGSFANGSVLSIKNPLGQTLNTITKQNESYRYISESNGAPNAWSKVLVDSHSHVSSDITNFNTSVSGLVSGIYAPLNNPSFIGIPTVPTATSGTNTNQIASTSFVRTEISNLLNSAPSTLDTLNELAIALGNDANFSTTVTNNLAGKANLNGAIFTGPVTIPSGTGNFNSLSVNGTGVSVNGHSHTSSNITNFNTSVSGLLPSVSGSGFVNSSFANNTYTISVNGLQPSGNYSIVGHSHLSSDITDFNSSVSGLLPVKNIIGGSGIQVGSVSGEYTITAAGIAASSASSLITEVYNNTGSTIPKMSVVYINGGQGNLPTIALAIASGESGSNRTYGITAEAISPNNNGDVVIIGALIDVDTNQFGATEGTTLYLSPTVPGGITTVKPLAPNHLVTVGTIVRTHQNQGVIEVRVQNGFELYELHDVKTSGVSDGQFLQYNGASGLWLSSSSGNFSTLQVNGTGVSISGHSHVISDVSGLQNALNSKQPSGIYASGIHSHGNLSSSGNIGSTSGLLVITGSGGLLTTNNDINISNIVYITGDQTISGLKTFPRIDITDNIYGIIKIGEDLVGGEYGIYDENDNAFAIKIMGGSFQYGGAPGSTDGIIISPNKNVGIGITSPSGQLHVIGTGIFSSGLYVNNVPVSVSGHSHSSSDITDLNSSVSGLLPVKNILAGSGIAVSGNLGDYTVSVGIIDCGIIAPTSIFIPPTVAYYAFNANVTDANALYDGTAYGSPSFVSGYVGNAIQLNSPSKYVTVPRSISTNWTIAFFVRTASASPSSSNWYDGVSLLNGEMPGDVNDFGVVYLNNKVSVGIGNPDTTIFSSSTINNNVWRHVCATRNSTTGQVKIYIDGTLETTANMPTGTKSAASTLIIGGSVKYGSFNGLIDNMKIFDSVLTDAQISSLATGN